MCIRDSIPDDWEVGDFIYDTVNLHMYWRVGTGGGETAFNRIVEDDELITVRVDGEITTNLDFIDGTNSEANGTLAVQYDYDNVSGEATASIEAPIFDVAAQTERIDDVDVIIPNLIDVVLTDVAENIYSTMSFEGDDHLVVSTVVGSEVIQITSSSISPVSHDPYSIDIALMDSITQDGRRFDVPHGSSGEATFTITATEFM